MKDVEKKEKKNTTTNFSFSFSLEFSIDSQVRKKERIGLCSSTYRMMFHKDERHEDYSTLIKDRMKMWRYDIPSTNLLFMGEREEESRSSIRLLRRMRKKRTEHTHTSIEQEKNERNVTVKHF